jgi:hypothetical protein
MNARLAVLGVWLAALPLAVDLPVSRDSSRTNPLQVEVAGGGGQFAIVGRGCEGEVLRVTRNQLRSGALIVEHRLPKDFVIGVRAGSVQTTLNTSTQVMVAFPGQNPLDAERYDHTARYSNRYVNPYIGREGRRAGLGIGVMRADRRFVVRGEDFSLEAPITGHVRLGGEQNRLTLRWMEDVPLESEGHFSADLSSRPTRKFEAGAFVGLAGPYDGAMFGLRGRMWFTPEAALQIKASVAGYGQYGVYGSVTARLPGVR